MAAEIDSMDARNGKVFNDSVHGTILLHPLLVKIVDTPEFQRLRYIKQMGGGYYVYPGAQHNRSEHSIGTAHLAGKLVRHLKELQPELKINDTDVLLVEMAGLCHDLGHGPFSHMFDRKFLKKTKEAHPRPGWEHEQGSCEMLQRVKEKIWHHVEAYNKHMEEKEKEELKISDQDFKFVEEMIDDSSKKCEYAAKRSELGHDKTFLCEIVSNKISGVDVDKWDYFARDCHHLGITNGFDHYRFIKCTRVIEVRGEDGKNRKQICARDKEIFNLYEMFHTRFVLHKRACQHPVVNAVELMICDALHAAENPPPTSDCEGEEISDRDKIKISDCILKENLSAFCNLDDRILLKIKTSKRKELAEAQKILERLEKRDLYRCVGNQILGRKQSELTEEQISKEIASKIPDDTKPGQNLKVLLVGFSYGKGKTDPVRGYHFYKKDKLDEAFQIPKEEVSSFLPDVFEEKYVQVFWKSHERIEVAETAFKDWCMEPEPSTLSMLLELKEKIENLEKKVDGLTMATRSEPS